MGFTRVLRGFVGVLGFGGEGLRGWLWVLGRRRLPEEEEEVVGFWESGVGDLRERVAVVMVAEWCFPAKMEEAGKGEE